MLPQNSTYNWGDILVVPEAIISEETALLESLDGRKMSKSLGNVIPLFANEKQLRKLIMKIKTNSLEPGVPKDPKDSVLYDIYSAFAMPEEILNIKKLYANGLAWGEMKNILFECINDQLKPAREEYQKLIDDPAQIEVQLKKGADRAREISVPYIQEIRNAIGIRKLV